MHGRNPRSCNNDMLPPNRKCEDLQQLWRFPLWRFPLWRFPPIWQLHLLGGLRQCGRSTLATKLHPWLWVYSNAVVAPATVWQTLTVAVAHHVGSYFIYYYSCPCGEQFDSRGIHGLSCRTSAGRSARHFMLNDIICRALASAGIPSVKEPVSLGSYVDEGGVEKGLRPDGLTLIPWSSGRCLAWDATVRDTLAPSYLPLSIHSAGAVAEAAADRKRRKYSSISWNTPFHSSCSGNTRPNLRGRCQFHFRNCGKNIKSHWRPAWKDFFIPENFRGNTAWHCSCLPRNHGFLLWEYAASHLRSRPVIYIYVCVHVYRYIRVR